MPWSWDGKGRKSVDHGGSVGTVSEASRSTTWPSYQAGYLAQRLAYRNTNPGDITPHRLKEAAERDKYAVTPDIVGDAERAAYIDRVTANYKSEADECLKQEFMEWMQGTHEVLNDPLRSYPNHPGTAERKYVFYDGEERKQHGGGVGLGVPTTRMDEWKPTWWGKGSLMHLDGTREFMREMKINANDEALKLNLLAEFGPQNIEQAWIYFKHWVKGRKLSEADCGHLTSIVPPGRAPAGPVKPDEFYHNRPSVVTLGSSSVPGEGRDVNSRFVPEFGSYSDSGVDLVSPPGQGPPPPPQPPGEYAGFGFGPLGIVVREGTPTPSLIGENEPDNLNEATNENTIEDEIDEVVDFATVIETAIEDGAIIGEQAKHWLQLLGERINRLRSKVQPGLNQTVDSFIFSMGAFLNDLATVEVVRDPKPSRASSEADEDDPRESQKHWLTKALNFHAARSQASSSAASSAPSWEDETNKRPIMNAGMHVANILGKSRTRSGTRFNTQGGGRR